MGAEMTERQTENNIHVIASLIKSCRAAQAGFLSAAERTRNSDLGAFFTGRSMERARFAAELERAVRQLGAAEMLGLSTPMTEHVHQAWVELSLARGSSDSGILRIVAEAEHAIWELYRQALSMQFPRDVAALIERQADSVSDAYDQICTLRDMRGKAA